MTQRTAAEAVVDALQAEGVECVFGLIGTAVLDLLDVLHGRTGIRYVGVRHEQNAVHMADAYARVSGRAGVVIAGQPGPGVTNTATGVAQAHMAFSPVVVIAGDTDTTLTHSGTFQEIDQQAMLAPITKLTMTAGRADRLEDHVRRAFSVAMSGRRGPVVLNVPGDLFAVPVPARASAPGAGSLPPAAPSPREAAAAASLLASAHRPLIIAGAGVKWSRASAAVVSLAERIQAPIAASAGNGDVVANDHPLFRGQVGPRGNEVATDLARRADVILAVGTRLGFNTTFFKRDMLAEDVQIIHIDVEASAVGRHFPAAVGVAADAGETLAALLPLVEPITAQGAWVEDSARAYKKVVAARAEAGGDGTSPHHPVALVGAIQRALPKDAIVTIDTGTCSLAATDTIQTFEPPALLTPLDFGLVGFSYPAGLGAKAAAPHRPVLSIVGDGGFGMSMGEIGTALAAGLPTVTVVFDNGSWGAEKAYQRDFYGGRYLGADLVNPRFDEVAESFGAVGVRAATLDEVSTAVARGFSDDAATVIHASVDPSTMQAFRRRLFEERSSGTK